MLRKHRFTSFSIFSLSKSLDLPLFTHINLTIANNLRIWSSLNNKSIVHGNILSKNYK